MKFTLVYSRRAEKEVLYLGSTVSKRVLDGCKRLMSSPFPDGKHVKKMKGYENLYRLRVGDFRIVFKIFGKCVQVIDVLSKPDFQKSY